MSKTDRIYGIDLGTTNSCIAVLEDGVPHVIPVDGSGIVPSVVSFDGKKFLVGRKARNRAAAFPEQSVRSVKRLMGGNEKLELGGKSYEPEDISAMILRYLCDEAGKLEGHEVKHAVITVPAYFTDAQRLATIEAGTRAGLSVRRIINEPTAASLFYDHVSHTGQQALPGKTDKADKEIYALVYDLGGGTFDVSILRMGEIIEVLASTGDSHLGGDDFDRRLTDEIIKHVYQQDGLDLSEHLPAMARLSAIAEEAKLTLSEKAYVLIQETQIPVPGKPAKNYSVSLEFSREEFEHMTKGLVDRTMASVNKAMEEAKLTPDRIDRVLLVGGMTRMPAVASKLEEMFGAARLPAVDPDLSVCKGAAIQGGIISGENCAQILVDVTPHTLSLESLSRTDGIMGMTEEGMELKCVPIIPRNTQIPAARARTFQTLHYYQEGARLRVYQGESDDPAENTLIGETMLRLAPAEAGCPITVEYSYDLNGVVHLVAEQKGYSRKTEVRLDSRSPKLYASQNLEEPDMDENDEDSDEATPKRSAPVNFVIQRARVMLGKMENSAEKTAFADLLRKYENALSDDGDAVDELEDALLSAMENNS